MLSLKKITCCLLYFFLFVFVGSLAWVLTYKFINPQKTYLMHLRQTQARKKNKNLLIKQEWTCQDKMSRHLKEAIIFSEDSGFYNHYGVVWDKVYLAYKIHKNRQEGDKVFGFSTITQQTAKNIFLYPDKSLFRKTLEVYFALCMELLWGKERILEVYLNTIELGDGIFGVQAAAEHYYKKNAQELSIKESYWLASIMAKPLKLSRHRHIMNPFLKMRVDCLLSCQELSKETLFNLEEGL
jgi:monofunctional biosynthetic peptidoglycan transglycosylase